MPNPSSVLPRSISPLIRSLLSGATIALMGDLLARALSLLVAVLVARWLGPSQYGEYTAVFASLALLASAIGFGLDTWLLREGGRNPQRLLNDAAAVLLTKLVAAIVLVVALTEIGNRITLTLPFLVGCAGIIGDSFLNTGFAVLRARRRNFAVALAQLLLPGILLIVLLVLRSLSVTPLLLIAVQSTISWAVVLSVFGWGLTWLVRANRAIRPNLRLLLTGAWAFVIADLLANIYGQSATLQLRTHASLLEVGIFKAALSTIAMAYIPPAIVFNVSLPILSSPNTSAQDYRRIIRLWLTGALVYGVAVALVVWLAAPLVIGRLYGVAYADSVELLRWFSISPLLKTCSFVCTLILLSRQRQTLRIIMQGIAVALNLILGAWLIPWLGLWGATQVTLYTDVLILFFYALAALRIWRTTPSPI